MYSTLSASNYMAAIVTDEFLQGVAWNTSNLDHLLEDEAIGQRQLVRLQSNVDHLTRLENQDCIRAYGTNFLQSSWKNVLIVSDANVTGPFVIGYYHRADLRNDDLAWICGKQGQMNTRCDTQMMLSHPTNWIIADIEMHQSNYRGGAAGLPYFEASVKYCLAEPAKQHCTVKISTPLLGMVLFCNLIKVICLSSALLLRNFHPMATVGDLISSCLREPDPCTQGQGPLSARDVRRTKTRRLVLFDKPRSELLRDYRAIYFERSISLSDYPHSKALMAEDSAAAVDVVEESAMVPVKWKKQKNRWCQASSTSSWVACMVLCAIAWFTGVILMAIAVREGSNDTSQTYTLSRMWQDGTYARVQIPRARQPPLPPDGFSTSRSEPHLT
jgi:hypothetical protein